MQTAVYGLGILGTIGLFAASLLFSSNKIAFLWVLFGTLVTYLLAFTLYWHAEILVKESNRTAEKSQPKLIEPRFSEDVSKVMVSLGERGFTDGCHRSSLEKEPREPFSFAGHKPVKLYIQNGALYADVVIYGGSRLPPIEILHNKLIGKPPEWDMNSNSSAMEIVDENKTSIYQFIYKTPSHIVINGIFPFPGGLILANSEGVVINPTLPTTFHLKRIFKYPSWQYPGVYEE